MVMNCQVGDDFTSSHFLIITVSDNILAKFATE